MLYNTLYHIKTLETYTMKKAIIIGISGQDGSFLANHLINRGYTVIGTSRDVAEGSFQALKKMELFNQIKLVSLSLMDFKEIIQLLTETKPSEVYNLSGQTSVGLSFTQPIITMESVAIATVNLLEAIRYVNPNIKFYNACSSECFGNCLVPASEETRFQPNSPYAIAKSSAFWFVKHYRESYNMFAVSGILSNHESEFRNERFVTRKIINTAARIFSGEKIVLEVGNTEVIRDWGLAEEYCLAMVLMMNAASPEDFIIATGKSISLLDFILYSFKCLGLNYKDHTIINETLFRPGDSKQVVLNPEKAFNVLNWKAQHNVYDLIENLLKKELSNYKAKSDNIFL